jgi:hypothetical protein
MLKLKYIMFLVVVMALSGCSKQIIVSRNVDGVYQGTFEVNNTNPVAGYKPITTDVRVNFSGINYASAVYVNNVSAGATGKFFIKKDVITFTDTLMHTANFDWSLLLNGSYAYTIKGDSIILVKKIGSNTYTYRLKKQ